MAEFYSARGWEIPPLPWTNLSPPFSGTYGAGITRHLALSGIPVLEVTGPDPASRRAKGKDDALDAISAAEAARTRRRVQVAKDRSGSVEALRVLRTTVVSRSVV